MKIQINEKNRDKINDVLSETAGNAYAHTISVYYELEELVQRAEQKLDASGLLVKDRRSARLTFSPAGPGSAYAKKARNITTTRVIIERGANGWLLKSVERIEKPSYQKEGWDMEITAEQAGIITAHAMSHYSIAA